MKLDLDDLDRKPRLEKIIKSTVIWMIQIAFVIFLAFCLINYGMEKMTMDGEDMSPTISGGDGILINKISYRFTEPERFDIIVFKQQGKEHSFYRVSRIVGLPGETVQMKDGSLYINGKIQKEVSNVELAENGGLANNVITLDDNEYFVLGDNRNDSEDSRYASIGNIIRDDIVGKAWFNLSTFNFTSSANLMREVEETVNPSSSPSATDSAKH